MEITNHHRSLIALLQVPNFGVRIPRTLIRVLGLNDASEAFNCSLADILKVDGIGKQRARNLIEFDDWGKVDKIIKKSEKLGAKIISYKDSDYPDLLKHTFDPPLLLWVLGSVEALNKPGIGVVGTRNPGSYGLKQAERWTELLVDSGISINSGLAYGVDAKAHQTAVKNGGVSVGVLGSGIDRIYPEKNRPIANAMIENGGAVITEYPPGSKPDAVHFPERNRIVSGMSHGILVIESGIKGGSMITARLALDQNREVFVVPHQLEYKKGEGCNYLIKTGQGKLVQTREDILNEISIQTEMDQSNPQSARVKTLNLDSLSSEERAICELFENGEIHIDEMGERLSEPTYKLMPILLDLEMRGIIKQKAGKYFELC